MPRRESHRRCEGSTGCSPLACRPLLRIPAVPSSVGVVLTGGSRHSINPAQKKFRRPKEKFSSRCGPLSWPTRCAGWPAQGVRGVDVPHWWELPIPPALPQGQKPSAPKQTLRRLRREILGTGSQGVWSRTSPRAPPCPLLCSLPSSSSGPGERGRLSVAGSCAQLL